jgi:hypothetical protein
MMCRAVILGVSVIVWAGAVSPSLHAQAFGQRCQTARGWCSLSTPLPVGTACFCPTPAGPARGSVVQ